jgi:hypothetical protein
MIFRESYQRQNPEFGHKQDEIQKNPSKKAFNWRETRKNNQFLW